MAKKCKCLTSNEKCKIHPCTKHQKDIVYWYAMDRTMLCVQCVYCASIEHILVGSDHGQRMIKRINSMKEVIEL